MKWSTIGFFKASRFLKERRKFFFSRDFRGFYGKHESEDTPEKSKRCLFIYLFYITRAILYAHSISRENHRQRDSLWRFYQSLINRINKKINTIFQVPRFFLLSSVFPRLEITHDAHVYPLEACSFLLQGQSSLCFCMNESALWDRRYSVAKGKREKFELVLLSLKLISHFRLACLMRYFRRCWSSSLHSKVSSFVQTLRESRDNFVHAYLRYICWSNARWHVYTVRHNNGAGSNSHCFDKSTKSEDIVIVSLPFLFGLQGRVLSQASFHSFEKKIPLDIGNWHTCSWIYMMAIPSYCTTKHKKWMP